MRFALTPRATLGALTALNVLNYFDRYLAAAVLPLIMAEMALSDTRGGALQSSLMVVYTVVCPLAGWLATSHSRFRLAGLGAVVFSLATAGSGFAPTYAVLVITRALVGFGEATYAVVTPTLLSDTHAPAQRGRVMALFYAAIPVGTALGFQVGGVVGARYGYRTAFFLAAIPGLILAVAFLLFKDPPRGQMDENPRQAEPASLRETLGTFIRHRSFIWNTAAQTIYTFSMGGLAVWMPTYYQRQHGLSLSAATTGFGIIVVTSGFIGTLLGGHWGDRWALKRLGGHFSFSGVALLLSLPFSVGAVLGDQPKVYWPCLFVTLLLLFVNTGPLHAAMVNSLPIHLRERAFGVNTFCIHALGDVFSPVMIGFASDRVGLRYPILVTALLLPLAGLVLIAGRSALKKDLERMASGTASST